MKNGKWPILTLWQPHASLFPNKWFETRGWQRPWTYRGPLIIHAGKSKDDLNLCKEEPYRSVLSTRPYGLNVPLGKVMGAGLVTSVDVCDELTRFNIPEPTRYFGDFSEGRLAIRVERYISLSEPVQWVGVQGIGWVKPQEVLPDDVIDQLCESWLEINARPVAR